MCNSISGNSKAVAVSTRQQQCMRKRPMKKALPNMLLTLEHLPCVKVEPREVKCKVVTSWASKILEDGSLWLGDAGDAVNWEEMRKHGITHVVNATVECPYLEGEKEGFSAPEVLRVPVRDDCDAPLKDYFYDVATFIEESRQSGGRILVHCRGGVSRSATLVAAYLMIQNNLSSDQTFDYLRTRRSVISPNIGFLLSLEQLERALIKDNHRSCKPSPLLTPCVPPTIHV
eukprot:TRINITY_DN14124_c0_g1_i1.p1 TRINITY_DN14124_c0_g1~~TRINITY_DN14124_c0_g1_i1.p1  ORF type:complete len:230 (+),score=43.53 TRINITY_DN14124_c0_g1_i1:85-774(+)